MTPDQVLRTLAELSNASPANPSNVLRSSKDFAWLRPGTEQVFGGKPVRVRGVQSRQVEAIDRVLATGSLHRTEQMLRIGWIWLVDSAFDGPADDAGTRSPFCFPLLSVPVASLETTLDSPRDRLSAMLKDGVGIAEQWTHVVEAVGDIELTHHITDKAERSDLLEILDLENDRFIPERRSPRGSNPKPAFSGAPELEQWCERAVRAIGVDVDGWLRPDPGDQPTRADADGLVGFVGPALYMHQAPTAGSEREALLKLALTPGLGTSALAKTYADTAFETKAANPISRVRPLSVHQAHVASRAGAADLAVISGPPGTGKTHVLSTIALDAVARGNSVLLVGSSPHAVDVLFEHFDRVDSVLPVAFGGSRHTQRAAHEFSNRVFGEHSVPEDTGLIDSYEAARSGVERKLGVELEYLRITSDELYKKERAATLEQAGDLDEIARAVEGYFRPRPLDLLKRNDKQLENCLAVDLNQRGVSAEELETQLNEMIEDLVVAREAQRLSSTGGLSVDDDLQELFDLDERSRPVRWQLINSASHERLTREQHELLPILAGALISNRVTRAQILARAPIEIADAAPLWIGTATDALEVLPRTASMFDLVIIDEAALASQGQAAGALARARRAVICGDPQQLGLRSFISEEQLDAATALFNTDPSILDVRTKSIFDVAASQVPVEVLDEHYRSVPHLIDFSARNFYGGELKPATRHPATEGTSRIRVEVVADGVRTGPKSRRANHSEVERCLAMLDQHISTGWRSIGLVTPFRAQADALEAAVLEKYTAQEIDQVGLRVGTVHGFQGDERDLMIISLAVGHDEPDQAWRFVNQRTLFNVMVTRAKQGVVVVTSSPEPPGLSGEYLRWATTSSTVETFPVDDPWVYEVADALSDCGVLVRTGYPVGRHRIDLVAGGGTMRLLSNAGRTSTASPHTSIGP